MSTHLSLSRSNVKYINNLFMKAIESNNKLAKTHTHALILWCDLWSQNMYAYLGDEKILSSARTKNAKSRKGIKQCKAQWISKCAHTHTHTISAIFTQPVSNRISCLHTSTLCVYMACIQSAQCLNGFTCFLLPLRSRHCHFHCCCCVAAWHQLKCNLARWMYACACAFACTSVFLFMLGHAEKEPDRRARERVTENRGDLCSKWVQHTK